MSVSRGVWRVLRWSGLPFLMRHALQGDRATILCYHDPDPATLSRHLAALGTRYHFISLREYLDARRANAVDALPKRALIVTLDDGAAGNSLLLGTFRRHAVVPTIFLTTGIVGTSRAFWWKLVPGGSREAEALKAVPDAERIAALAAHGQCETDATAARTALSRAEIEDMSAWVDFQSHTVLHPVLSRCSDERARTEIAGSKAHLESEYGLRVYALAYPNGTPADFGRREIALAAQAGYECAVTMVPGTNGPHTDPFELRRIAIPDGASCDEVLVRASLVFEYLKRLRRLPRGRRSVA